MIDHAPISFKHLLGMPELLGDLDVSGSLAAEINSCKIMQNIDQRLCPSEVTIAPPCAHFEVQNMLQTFVLGISTGGVHRTSTVVFWGPQWRITACYRKIFHQNPAKTLVPGRGQKNMLMLLHSYLFYLYLCVWCMYV